MLTVKYAKTKEDGSLGYIIAVADEVEEVSNIDGTSCVYAYRYQAGLGAGTVEKRINLGGEVKKVFVENQYGKTVQCFSSNNV